MILVVWAPMKKNFVLFNFVVSVLEVTALLGTCFRENWERKIVLSEPQVDEKSFYNNFLILCWCLLTVALAILIAYAVKKESHYLCNTWFMCECLMLVFILIVAVYIYSAYGQRFTWSYDNLSFLKHPRMKLILVLHVFLKMYGLWVISEFMNSINARARRISNLIQSIHPNLPHSIIISEKSPTESNTNYEKENKNNCNASEVEQENDTDKEEVEVEHKQREFKESFKYQRL